MTVKSKHVRIKGIKDGLVFLLDDKCPFEDLLSELRYKLEHSHQNILTGPIVHVDIKLGNRPVTEEDKEAVLDILKSQGNLLIRSVEALEDPEEKDTEALFMMSGMLRSGQVLHHEGNLLFLGDVNPGEPLPARGISIFLERLKGWHTPESTAIRKRLLRLRCWLLPSSGLLILSAGRRTNGEPGRAAWNLPIYQTVLCKSTKFII